MEFNFKNGDEPIELKQTEKNLVLTGLIAVKGDLNDFNMLIVCSKGVRTFTTPFNLPTVQMSKTSIDGKSATFQYELDLRYFDFIDLKAGLMVGAKYDEYEFILSYHTV